MEISMAFFNLSKTIEEDCSAATNLIIANIARTEQVALYANRLSTKEADNMALQAEMKTYRGR